MKNALLLAGVALTLTSAAFAQDAKPAKGVKTAAVPKTIKCAVMAKDDVNVADATKTKMFADYKGNRYFFCCAGCPTAFKKDPAKYASAPHIPTPKAAPAKKKA